MFDRTSVKIDLAELETRLKKHDKYLQGRCGGQRLDLSFKRIAGTSILQGNLAHAELVGTLMIDCDLSQSDLSNANLFCANLSGSTCRQTNFEKADCRGAKFDCSDLRGANFEHADCRPARLIVQDRSGNLNDVFDVFGEDPVSFRNAKFYNSNFKNAQMPRASFRGANIEQTRFDAANMGKADFSKATIKNTVFYQTNLTDADFSKSDLTECDIDQDSFRVARLIRHIYEIDPKLRKKIENHRLWVETLSKEGKRLQLTGGDLHGLDMSDVDWAAAEFTNVDMHEIVLARANLSMAKFIRCNLNNSDLIGVNARGTSFIECRMIESDMSRSDFSPLDIKGRPSVASFDRSDLTDVIIGGAKMQSASFKGANLSRATVVGTNLSKANMSETDLTQADFRGSELGLINFTKATKFHTRGLAPH